MIYAIAFAIATLADIVTTNLVLSKGGRELNGIVAWFMERLGRFWWLPKALITAAFFLVLDTWPDNDALLRYGVGVAAIVSALVAARNYAIYRRM
ncbi:DUF5658 family protein [Celeribacter halophilus]|uniref:DUF5658 family protein n=1 Tax=Celeribacter halophilus TaxID=576117 RepID=UPI003A931B40